MTSPAYQLERLSLPVSNSELTGLAQLLADTVNSGASVSFMAPLDFEGALEWWQKTLSSASPGAIYLVARDSERIVGTVQLHPAWAPNQPHRAEVAKLMVHPRCRRSGLGARLMQAIEDAARHAGFTLLTLDTKRGEAAEQLYRKSGWTAAGIIPGYALNTDGKAKHDTVIFYKELS